MAGKSYEIGNEDFAAKKGKYQINNITNQDKIILKDALREDLTFKKSGNTLIIDCGDDNSLILKDYFKSKAANALTELTVEGDTFSFYDVPFAITSGGKTINGTFLNDFIIGFDKSEVIKSGGGLSDTIWGGKGNDTIYAQAKENDIQFFESMGKNVVYASKVQDNNNIITFRNFEDQEVSFAQKGNDVIISPIGAAKKGSVTIKDYLKDAQANVGYRFDEDGEIKDLDSVLNQLQEFINVDKSLAKKGQTISGTRLDETIIGSKYADKIYANGGNDTISAGKGNDKIYVKGGTTSLNFKAGDGNDTVYYTPDETSKLYIDFDEAPELRYTKTGNDLNIFYTTDENHQKEDKITIKDYYKYRDSIYINNVGSEGVDPVILGNSKKSNKITSSIDSAFIFGGSKNDTITVSNNNNLIFGKGGNDYIKLSGKEQNYQLGFYAGDGTDTIDTADLVDSNINFADIDKKYYVTEDGKSVIAADFGGYEVAADYYFKDAYPNGVTSARTDDITNSKMIFKDFLANENNVSLGGYSKDDFKGEDTTFGKYYVMPSDKKYTYGNNATVEGTSNDDYVITGSQYNDVKTGAGDDIVVAAAGKSIIDMGEGNDTLVVRDIKKSGSIVSNVNNIQINGVKESDLYFVFDVDANGNMVTNYVYDEENPEEYDVPLFGITTKDNLKKFFTGANAIGGDDIDDKEFIKSGILVEQNDYGSIEDVVKNITLADKNGLNASNPINIDSTIRAIANNIAVKLRAWGYSSLSELLATEPETKKEAALLKKYQNEILALFQRRTDGNDTLTASEDFKTLKAGKGNDVYNVDIAQFENDIVTISDTAGKDTLNITGIGSDELVSVFDVSLKTDKKDRLLLDKNGVPAYKNSGSLEIGKTLNGTDGITIENYFGNGKIETIKVGDDIIASNKEIAEKSLAVANWLYINDYLNTQAVWENGEDEEKEALASIYQKGVVSGKGVIEGTEDNDYIAGSNGNDTIYANGGSDTMVGGKGNDTYVITADQFMGELSTIYDVAGKDTLQIGEEGTSVEDLKVLFKVDLQTDKKGNILTNKDGSAKFKTSGGMLITDRVPYTDDNDMGGVYIKDYFGKGKIENIVSNNETVISADTINQTAQKIANWLLENGYTSTEDVLDGDDDDKINELYALINGDNYMKASDDKAPEIYDTKMNDYIVGRESKRNQFYSQAGGNDTLVGGVFDDTYELSNWTGDKSREIVIKDKGTINNIIRLNDKNNTDVSIIFNVDKDGNFTDDEEYGIMLKSDVSKLYDDDNSDFGIVNVKGFASINRIQTSDKYYITDADLNKIRESVAAWLGSNNYDDVASVFAQKNEADINALIAEFNKIEWKK